MEAVSSSSNFKVNHAMMDNGLDISLNDFNDPRVL
jgi:hypothetical protein